MKKPVFSVRDFVADTFALPFVSLSGHTALRDFSLACRDPNSMLAKSPESYALYQIGYFNEDTGELVPDMVSLVANATQFTGGDE